MFLSLFFQSKVVRKCYGMMDETVFCRIEGLDQYYNSAGEIWLFIISCTSYTQLSTEKRDGRNILYCMSHTHGIFVWFFVLIVYQWHDFFFHLPLNAVWYVCLTFYFSFDRGNSTMWVQPFFGYENKKRMCVLFWRLQNGSNIYLNGITKLPLRLVWHED